MIKEKFLEIITNDFNGDESFVGSRLPNLLNQAMTKLVDILGSELFAQYKASEPQTITRSESNGDGTVELSITDSGVFSVGDTVIFDIISTSDGTTYGYSEPSVVTDVDTDSNKMSVYGDEFGTPIGISNRVMSKFYYDITLAGAYLTAHYAVLSLMKMTQEGSNISSLTYGNQSNTFSSIDEAKKLMSAYYDRAVNLIDEHITDSEDTHGIIINFI